MSSSRIQWPNSCVMMFCTSSLPDSPAVDHGYLLLNSTVAFVIVPVFRLDHVVVTASVLEYDDPYAATRSRSDSSFTELSSRSRRNAAPAPLQVAAAASMLAAHSAGTVEPMWYAAEGAAHLEPSVP